MSARRSQLRQIRFLLAVFGLTSLASVADQVMAPAAALPAGPCAAAGARWQYYVPFDTGKAAKDGRAEPGVDFPPHDFYNENKT